MYRHYWFDWGSQTQDNLWTKIINSLLYCIFCSMGWGKISTPQFSHIIFIFFTQFWFLFSELVVDPNEFYSDDNCCLSWQAKNYVTLILIMLNQGVRYPKEKNVIPRELKWAKLRPLEGTIVVNHPWETAKNTAWWRWGISKSLLLLRFVSEKRKWNYNEVRRGKN